MIKKEEMFAGKLLPFYLIKLFKQNFLATWKYLQKSRETERVKNKRESLLGSCASEFPDVFPGYFPQENDVVFLKP